MACSGITPLVKFLVIGFFVLSFFSPSLSYPIRKVYAPARTPTPVCQTRMRSLCIECISNRVVRIVRPISSSPQRLSLMKKTFRKACLTAVAENRPHRILNLMPERFVLRAAHDAESRNRCSFLLSALRSSVICPLQLSPLPTGILNGFPGTAKPTSKPKLKSSPTKTTSLYPFKIMKLLNDVPGVDIVRREKSEIEFYSHFNVGLALTRAVSGSTAGKQRRSRNHFELAAVSLKRRGDNHVPTEPALPPTYNPKTTKAGSATIGKYILVTKDRMRIKEMRKRLRDNFFNRMDVKGKFKSWKLKQLAEKKFELKLFRK